MGAVIDNALGDLLAPWLLGGALILVRLVVMVSFVPAFGEREVPLRIRVILAVVLSAILDLALGGVAVPVPDDPFTLGMMVGREAILGFGLGFAVHLIIATASAAGATASMTMGLGMSNMVDPVSGENSLSLGALLSLVAALMFVTLDGHHVVIGALAKHLRGLPVGSLSLELPSLNTLVGVGDDLVRTAILLAAPVLTVTLLLNISIGFISRVVPSVNLFGIGLGLLILGALIALQHEGQALLRIVEHEVERLPDRMFRLAPGS
ncbi:MAG: hypothetical protein AMXMBFR64_49340 [Myxococcales bacterium]